MLDQDISKISRVPGDEVAITMDNTSANEKSEEELKREYEAKYDAMMEKITGGDRKPTPVRDAIIGGLMAFTILFLVISYTYFRYFAPVKPY